MEETMEPGCSDDDTLSDNAAIAKDLVELRHERAIQEASYPPGCRVMPVGSHEATGSFICGSVWGAFAHIVANGSTTR